MARDGILAKPFCLGLRKGGDCGIRPQDNQEQRKGSHPRGTREPSSTPSTLKRICRWKSEGTTQVVLGPWARKPNALLNVLEQSPKALLMGSSRGGSEQKLRGGVHINCPRRQVVGNRACSRSGCRISPCLGPPSCGLEKSPTAQWWQRCGSMKGRQIPPHS